MQASDVQQLFLRRHGIRIEPEMAHYVLRRLPGGAATAAIPVMGADARTGLPLRQMIDVGDLAVSSQPSITDSNAVTL